MNTIIQSKPVINLSQIFVFFSANLLLFQILLIYFRKHWKQFKTQKSHVQIGIVLRICSAIHATIVTFLSVYILYFDKNLFQNKLLYSSHEICFTLNFSIGFLAFDMLIMSIYREEFEWNFILHHFVSITAFHSCTNMGVFPFIALFRLTSEGSTPFLNIRWILLALSKKNSKYYIINGLLLLLTFFIVRILTIAPNWYLFVDAMNSPGWNSVDMKYKLICVGSCIPLDVLNVFWFCKILRGVLKFFFVSSSSKKDSHVVSNINNNNNSSSNSQHDEDVKNFLLNGHAKNVEYLNEKTA